jgi:MEMO1 family protein
MNFERMQLLAKSLSLSIASVMKKKKMKWGQDLALVVSADAVHYGDEEWGGQNFAFYGADSAGYRKAIQHERVIIDSCLTGIPDTAKVKQFTSYTVKKENYKEYKWTWCGRYSVPLGVLVTYYLNDALKEKQLKGTFLGYRTSIDNKRIPVSDLGGMGITAKAFIRHWVGYAAIGYK